MRAPALHANSSALGERPALPAGPGRSANPFPVPRSPPRGATAKAVDGGELVWPLRPGGGASGRPSRQGKLIIAGRAAARNKGGVLRAGEAQGRCPVRLP